MWLQVCGHMEEQEYDVRVRSTSQSPDFEWHQPEDEREQEILDILISQELWSRTSTWRKVDLLDNNSVRNQLEEKRVPVVRQGFHWTKESKNKRPCKVDQAKHMS